jgi:hypothetical protein
VYEQNGEVWLEKRVEEYVLTSADVTFLSTAYAEVETAFVPNIDGIALGVSANIDGKTNIYDWTETNRGVRFVDSYWHGDANISSDNKILYFGFAKGTTLAQAQADLAGTVVQYQLATPQLINLTQEGKVDGELAVYENGTVYNTSDTFHADLSFDVASNRSAQISGLLDSSVYQAKLIDSKASKVQEAWIEPTLLNGWVNFGSGFSNIAYFKDEFDFVHLRGLIKDGTTTANTTLFTLPVGYRPLAANYFITADIDGFARLYITDHNKFFDNPNYTAQWRMHAGYGQPEVEPTPVDMSVVWTRIEPNSDNYKTAIRIHWPGNPIEYLLDRNEQYNKVSGWGPLMTKYEWLVFHIDIIDSTNNTVVYPAIFSLPYIWETERELADLGCGV